MNSAIWRQGPPVFQNEKVLLNQTFIRYNRDTKNLDVIKKMPQHMTTNKQTGPQSSKQIVEQIGKHVFATSKDGDITEAAKEATDDMIEEETGSAGTEINVGSLYINMGSL